MVEEVNKENNTSDKDDRSDDDESQLDDSDDSIVISFTYMADKHGSDNDRDRNFLDTGSNCSVFNNIKMLQSVRKSNLKLRAMTNGECHESQYRGMLPGFLRCGITHT